MMNAVANSRAIFLFVCVCGVGESEAFASFVLSLLIATHLIFALPIEYPVRILQKHLMTLCFLLSILKRNFSINSAWNNSAFLDHHPLTRSCFGIFHSLCPLNISRSYLLNQLNMANLTEFNTYTQILCSHTTSI